MPVRYLLLFYLLVPASCLSNPSPEHPSELRDLHYGEALYQLYQQHYFSAIVHLLAAKQQGYMQTYGDEPDLLLGGLYLAYGMPNIAESLFQDILRYNTSPATHDRAWLQLAKSRHQRAQPQAARSALAKVGDALPAAESAERLALQGLLELQRGERAKALHTLKKLPDSGDWSVYGQYNQAIALLQMQQTKAGLKLLQGLGAVMAADAETKALRDQANLIRGYLLLEMQQAVVAKTVLEQIRLSSPLSNQALLGVGWAALQLDDPQGALIPWQELASRDARDPAVLEVMLAIPYALSLLQANTQSLHHYQLGIERYQQELSRLDRAIDAIRQGYLLLMLQKNQPGGSQYDVEQLVTLLPTLLTENSFQEHLQNFRELTFLQANLQTWQEKISDYQTMLEVRQTAYWQRLPRVEAKLGGNELQHLEAEHKQLQQLMQQANLPLEPAFSLANSQEKRQLERIDQIERLISLVGKHRDVSSQVEQLQLLKGILVWSTVTEHPSRSWEISKKLGELEQALQQASSQQAALHQANRESQGRFEHFSQKIITLEQVIPQQLADVSKTKSSLTRFLEQLAIRVLERRKLLINDYIIQARYGIASLLDRSDQTPGTVE